MGITYRLIKGAKINAQEYDDSLRFLDEKIDELNVPIRYKEIGDCLVFKKINPSTPNAIEIGDIIKRYVGNRYIHAKVLNLPYTTDSNLQFFEDITAL